MAKIIVDKYHLISMGLYAKEINNQPLRLTVGELNNFAHAYINDNRRPKNDYMNNVYSYDFSDIKLTDSDLIKFNPTTKTYYCSCDILQIFDKYMLKDKNNNWITDKIKDYFETLGKEQKYLAPEDQPIQ